MTAIPVPTIHLQPPGQSRIATARVENPYLTTWWTSQTASGIPENVMGWLVAQGWEITNVAQDNSTTPPTAYYALGKEGLSPKETLLGLCNSYTVAANAARQYNEVRYNQIVENWTTMVHSSHEHFKWQTDVHNADMGIYIGDLSTYMDQIDELSAQARNKLALDYDIHKETTEALLTDLGRTELARIKEQFAATLAVQLQDLANRGLYSSAVGVDIKARNRRDLDEQIQALNDRLNRENVENKHHLHDQNVQVANFRLQVIQNHMNTVVARMQGWRDVAAENQKLMAYQLDTRNNLLIGLYSFVERREDTSPEWADMAKMVASLGDQAGGWLAP